MKCIGCDLKWPILHMDSFTAVQKLHRDIPHRACEDIKGAIHVTRAEFAALANDPEISDALTALNLLLENEPERALRVQELIQDLVKPAQKE